MYASTQTRKPTDHKIRRARRKFRKLIRSTRGAFIVGRCGTTVCDERWSKYAPGPVFTIETGSAGVVSWLEVDLTEIGMNEFPRRCRNQQVGGGPQSDELKHTVYVKFV